MSALLKVLANPTYQFKHIGLEAVSLSQWLYSAFAEAGLPVICVRCSLFGICCANRWPYCTCRRLMTIPKVGPVVALTFRATIDEPARFHNSRAVRAILGLTPCKQQRLA